VPLDPVPYISLQAAAALPGGLDFSTLQGQGQGQGPAYVQPTSVPAVGPNGAPLAPGDGYVLVLLSTLRENAAVLAETEQELRLVTRER
jgi:hypothetical protein